MIALALMNLGLQPVPAKTATGRKHLPEGCREDKPQKGGVTRAVRQAVVERRAKMLELLRLEPLTRDELMGEFDVTARAIEMNLTKLGDQISSRVHKAERLYWAR